jgi:hypothetical protein
MSKLKSKAGKSTKVTPKKAVLVKKTILKKKKDEESSKDFVYKPESSTESEDIEEGSERNSEQESTDYDSNRESTSEEDDDDNEDDLGDEYEKYIKKNMKSLTKNHPGVEDKQLLRIIAYSFIVLKNEKKKKEKKTPEKSYWIVYHNEGNREDCSVFYSNIVKARTEHEAIIIGAVENGCNIKTLGARPMKVLTVDTMNKYWLD